MQHSTTASNVSQKWLGIWDIRINLDSDPEFRMSGIVCGIAPEMSWINYLVGISLMSHFAECRENRPVTMRNANKNPYSAVVREVEKWSGIRIRNRITIKS